MPPATLHRRLLDGGAVVGSLVGVYLSLWPSRPVLPTEAPAWWWVDLVAGLACTGLLLLRGRHPLGVALAVTVVGLVATTVWVAGPVAAFALAVRRPWPAVVGLTVVGLALSPVDHLFREPTPVASSWSTLGYAVLLSAVVITWGAAVRVRHQLVDSLVERAERAETEAGLRAEAARTAERTRIAREMHDVLAHRLSLVSMHAGALAHRGDVPPEEMRGALEVIRSGARDALTDLRAILGVLRDPSSGADDVEPASAGPQPTLTDLDRLVDGVRATGARVDLHDELPDGREAIGDECGRTLYRVAQEPLTNAPRHAPGRPVDVVLRSSGGCAELEVSNPLVPDVVPSAGAGTGLLGIAERVGLAGGRVVTRGPVDGRFRVVVRVPSRGSS